MLDMDTGEDQVLQEPTLLKALLRVRHWQKRGIFARQWDRVAKRIDPQFVGCCPSHAQFYRWLNGAVRGMLYPDACMILEAMFPGLTVQQLFQPTRISRNELLSVASAEDGDNHPVVDGIRSGRATRKMSQSESAEWDLASPDLVTAYAMRGLISRPNMERGDPGRKEVSVALRNGRTRVCT